MVVDGGDDVEYGRGDDDTEEIEDAEGIEDEEKIEDAELTVRSTSLMRPVCPFH